MKTFFLNYRFIFIVIAIVVCNYAYAQQLAFPEAEGFGRFATGERNVKVNQVPNLANTGKGFFRIEVTKPNRFLVLNFSGVTKKKTKISPAKKITIAGQTAP